MSVTLDQQNDCNNDVNNRAGSDCTGYEITGGFYFQNDGRKQRLKGKTETTNKLPAMDDDSDSSIKSFPEKLLKNSDGDGSYTFWGTEAQHGYYKPIDDRTSFRSICNDGTDDDLASNELQRSYN